MLGYIGSVTVPTLLLGDLNATPDAAELQPLRARLHDAWLGGEGFTYPSEKPVKRIDYILTSDQFRVGSAFTPQTLASDHWPVVAKLELSPAGGAR
jgi:endonuclease/exonuclease/phosphatase family metal-dependent hydrolase